MTSRLLFLLAILVMFMGCSSKKEQDLLNSYTKKMEYHKNLQQTESAELKSGEVSKAMLTATYMFRTTDEKNDTRDEVFLIAVNFDEENASINFNKEAIVLLKETNITENNVTVIVKNEIKHNKIGAYSLTINGKKAIAVERILDTDRRLKTLSFVRGWSEYYEVTFKNIQTKMFNLTFTHDKYGSDLLKFSKVGKFVYTKQGF